MVPRHEPITEIKKDVDLSEDETARELFIPLDGDGFEGKSASEVLKDPALMTDVQKQIEGALKQMIFSNKEE